MRALTFFSLLRNWLLESSLKWLRPDLPNVFTARPRLVFRRPLAVMVSNHRAFLRLGVTLRPHTEPEIAPMLAAIAKATVAVDVVELAAQGLAVEGAVESLAA